MCQEKQQVMAQVSASHVETWMMVQSSGFDLAETQQLWPLGQVKQWLEKISFCLSMPFLPAGQPVFQINEISKNIQNMMPILLKMLPYICIKKRNS